jgi:hypothetical protein
VANPNPQIKNLELGRGKRPKLNNVTVGMRMSPETKARLEEIAEDYGCFYGGKPWIAGLLEKIGSNELIVSKAPTYLLKDKSEKPSASPGEAMDQRGCHPSDQDINSVVADALVEHYGGVSQAAQQPKGALKEEKHSAEHTSVSPNSH